MTEDNVLPKTKEPIRQEPGEEDAICCFERSSIEEYDRENDDEDDEEEDYFDSFQREIDADLYRELEEMMDETSRQIEDELQAQVDQQLQASFDKQMEEYFAQAEQDDEEQRLQRWLKQQNLTANTTTNITNLSMKGAASGTVSDINAQIEEVIEQYHRSNLLDEK